MKKLLAILTALALLLTGGTLALAESAETAPAEIPAMTTEFPAAVAAGDISDFNGTWNISKVSLFGMTFDAASFGSMITVNDGNMTMTIDNGKVAFVGKDGGEFTFEDGKLVQKEAASELKEEIGKLAETLQGAMSGLAGELGSLAGQLNGLTESLGIDLSSLGLGDLFGAETATEAATEAANETAEAEAAAKTAEETDNGGLNAMLGSLLGQINLDGAELAPTIDLHEDGTICFSCMGIRFLFEKAE